MTLYHYKNIRFWRINIEISEIISSFGDRTGWILRIIVDQL